jgi:hypothetical protein
MKTYLLRRGVPIEIVYKTPDAAAELPRVAFLHENYLKAQHELRAYVALAVAAPVTAPMFYFLWPSILMLCCSVGFALIVLCTSIGQIARKRRTMKDYFLGLDRLVALVQSREPR